jgi:hypothetical protein
MSGFEVFIYIVLFELVICYWLGIKINPFSD